MMAAACLVLLILAAFWMFMAWTFYENFKLWRDAVIDELVVAHIYRAEHDTNPKLAVQDAIVWNMDVALDPAVSRDAAALRDTYLFYKTVCDATGADTSGREVFEAEYKHTIAGICMEHGYYQHQVPGVECPHCHGG